MYSVESLESAVRNLYETGAERGEYSEGEVERLLYGVDFTALTQAVRHKAETVYACTVRNEEPKSLNYRGRELFQQRATRLYTDFDQCTSGKVTVSRTLELWLLEDMTLTVTARILVACGDACCTEYREDKGEPWESGMFLDLEVLTEELLELCEEYTNGSQPYYEL